MDAPAPCAYDIKRSRGGGLSMASRTAIEPRNDNPAPGSYNQSSQFTSTGRGSSLGGRTALRTVTGEGVAPGSYQIGSTLKKGGISITGRPKKRGGLMMD